MPSAPTHPPGPLTRRSLLGGLLAGATAAATGCAWSTSQPRTPAPATVSALLADQPFYVAHRGGGGNWPEMTAYAYEQASRLPNLKAIEISVCMSADGVLVCSHDPTTKRVTGVDLDIATTPWSKLSKLEVSASGTTDATQPSRPLARLDDVLEAHADRLVLFIEPKVSAAGDSLMRRLVQLGQPERVVWKQPINSIRFAEAKKHGFATWGYVLDEPAHRGEDLQRFLADPDIDLVGVPRERPAASARELVSDAVLNGKPAIMWPISTEEHRDQALQLGCRGLMTSDLLSLLPRS
jgi:glycerophosphoryl diester phosphodiesterase